MLALRPLGIWKGLWVGFFFIWGFVWGFGFLGFFLKCYFSKQNVPAYVEITVQVRVSKLFCWITHLKKSSIVQSSTVNPEDHHQAVLLTWGSSSCITANGKIKSHIAETAIHVVKLKLTGLMWQAVHEKAKI